MSLFKRAYVRGVNDELIRLGYVRYPTKLAADEIADAVGDQMQEDPAAALGAAGPEEAGPPAGEPVSPETAAEVAATLVDAANKLVEETSGAGLAPEGEMPAPAEEELKTSAAQDLNSRAAWQAEALMYKSAEETKLALGSTIEGGDKGNFMQESPFGETVMENSNRPEGKYVLGVGNTTYPVGEGAVGTEEAHPEGPSESPAGSNSVIEQSKMGMTLRNIIRKVASEGMRGSTYRGGDTGGNSLAHAAAITGEGQLEAKQRPEGYAMGARGQGWGSVPSSAVVGTEQPHPHQPGETPGGSNSITSASKVGAVDPFIALFQKTANEVASFLPGNMPEEQKIAHIRQMMGMTDTERNEYIGIMHKTAGATDDQAVEVAVKHAECARDRHRYESAYGHKREDRRRSNMKTGGELPPALAAAIAKKNGNGDSDEHEKKEDSALEAKEEAAEKKVEKEDEKKEGADLLSRIRRISQSSHANA